MLLYFQNVTLSKKKKRVVESIIALVGYSCFGLIGKAFIGLAWGLGLGGASGAAFGAVGLFWGTLAGIASLGVGVLVGA